jgi:hypothetical protein
MREYDLVLGKNHKISALEYFSLLMKSAYKTEIIKIRTTKKFISDRDKIIRLLIFEGWEVKDTSREIIPKYRCNKCNKLFKEKTKCCKQETEDVSFESFVAKLERIDFLKKHQKDLGIDFGDFE